MSSALALAPLSMPHGVHFETDLNRRRKRLDPSEASRKDGRMLPQLRLIAAAQWLALTTVCLLGVCGLPRQTPGAEKESATPARPKPPPVIVKPEPIDIEPGKALSPWALVARPAPFPGVRSWTLDTHGHRGPTYGLAYHPDGDRFATAGQDCNVRIWDVPGARLLRILVGHSYPVYSLAWSPDGNTLASAGGDGTV